MSEASTHENLSSHASIKGSSDRSFGLVMAAFFGLVSVWPMVKHRALDFGAVRLPAVAVSVAFLLAAIAWPAVLHPLNVLWTKLGLLLGKIVNPIVMGILFFLVITPAAILLRLFGKDPLRLHYDKSAASYWIPRDPPGPAPDTMANQF